MTTLEEEPHIPTGDRLAETPLAEQSVRLLGGTAIELESMPQDLCYSVLRQAVDSGVQTPAEFSTLIHSTLAGSVRATNKERGRPDNAFIVNQQRVKVALADYYTVFQEANTPQYTPPTNKTHRQHIITYAQEAKGRIYSHPEIMLLVRLEDDLRTRAGEAEGNVAAELLAAYGMALQPNFRTARIDLYRSRGLSHILAQERKQQQ